MKTLTQYLIAVLFLMPLGLAAQSPAGLWKLSVPDREGNMIPLHVNISDDGTYSLDFGGDGAIETRGKYSVDNDKMTIQDTEGAECTAVGVYAFKNDGKTLTMTRISDGCADRGGPQGVMTMDKR